jgi:mannose-6-phosphate isomerase-like protein (cupin superfamily)
VHRSPVIARCKLIRVGFAGLYGRRTRFIEIRDRQMRAFNKSTTPTKLSDSGMLIYELVGRTLEQSTNRHSIAEVVIPPGKSSRRHYHPHAEKSYYVIQGSGVIEIDDASSTISSAMRSHSCTEC